MLGSLRLSRLRRRPPRRLAPDFREAEPSIGYDYPMRFRSVTVGWPGVRSEKGLLVR
ncbi:MAG TPA: hypothetical protein VM681_03535 [Candidatus Thermoplasmatota archaeon]|nr:hypothetical protein [Candidatus Thermoplasmatota archaeon]